MPTKLEHLIKKECNEDCEKAVFQIFDDMRRHLPLSYGKRQVFKLTFTIFATLGLFSIISFVQSPNGVSFTGIFHSTSAAKPLIIAVTPTYKRTTRLADMTRLANTLSHIKDLHWIVVEDGDQTYGYVQELLERSGIAYTYVSHRTQVGYPRRGWWQRNMAMRFIRENSTELLGGRTEGVLYFADDDNSYDLRLFDNYIRNVQKVGMWAVGLVGGAPVEAPRVKDGKVVGFNVKWNPKRVFAIDMAGFAVNLKVLLNSTAEFGPECKRGLSAPETCLLEDLGLKRDDVEPFGIETTGHKDILVWHTRTKTPQYDIRKMDTYGYVFEFGKNNTVGVPVKPGKRKHQYPVFNSANVNKTVS